MERPGRLTGIVYTLLTPMTVSEILRAIELFQSERTFYVNLLASMNSPSATDLANAEKVIGDLGQKILTLSQLLT